MSFLDFAFAEGGIKKPIYGCKNDKGSQQEQYKPAAMSK